jgi:DNA-binding transcriptional ArsR family regulator
VVKYPRARLDAVYGAISNPVRRSVLDQLRPHGATITQLAARYPMSLVAVSKHIRVLEDAGLVRRTIRGREHYLSLQAGPLRSAVGWLESYRGFWEDRLDLLDARLADRKRR